MVTYTTTYNLAKPTVGDDEDVWGGYLNGNFDTLESLLKGTTALTSLSLSGNITFGDNDKAIFGAGSDLQIYSDGANSIIQETDGTGNLLVRASNINLQNSGATATLAQFIDGGKSSLRYNGSEKLATTSTGIDVTGDIQASENLKADGGNLIIGDDAYSTSTAFVGMKTSFMTGTTDYMILSGTSDGNTYISAKDGNDVHIRGGGNNSVYAITVYPDQWPTIGGNTAWHAGNDGSGSGLDADTVDGLQASSFLRSDANDSTSGILTSTSNDTGSGGITVDSPLSAYISSDRGGTGYQAGYMWRTAGSTDWYNYISTSSAELKWYTTSNVMTLTTSGSLSTAPQGTLWGSSNDGSGSGLDADLWDGNQFSSYLNQAVLTTSNVTHNQVTATNYVYGNNLYAASGLIHWGDGDTSLIFTDNTITLNAGGSAEVTVNSTGVRLGDTGNGYFQPVSGDYGSIQIDGGAHGSHEGYSIGGRAVFMHDNASRMGLYDDVNNEWGFIYDFNSAAQIFYNGSSKLQTTSTGVNINGDLNAVDSIYVANAIYHEGDTNTYVSFGTDIVYVVSAGSTNHEFRNTYTQTFKPFYQHSVFYEDYDALSGTSVTVNCDTAQAFSLTMTGNTTFTFNSVTNAWSTGFVLELTGNGGTVTWPTSVDWAGGTAPDAPASGETDIYVFWTRDGGTTWYGVLSVDAAA